MSLADLQDERAISAVAIAYAAALDEHDWASFRALFIDEVDIDSRGLRGTPPSRMNVDAWVARVRSSVELFDAVLHYSTNHRISLAGDNAVCRTYGLAKHTYTGADGPKQFVVSSKYDYQMRRTADGWRIAGVTIEFVMKEGEPPPPRT